MIGILSLQTNNLEVDFCRFNSIEDLKACIQLSAKLARKSADKVYFFTDKRGIKLVEEFKHIFDEVFDYLEDLSWVHNYNWGLSKIYSYTFMKEPFFHVDIDAFIWDKLPVHFYDTRQTEFFFQNYESLDLYKFYDEGLKHIGHLLPKNISQNLVRYAYNCGIAGFNDISIIPDYYQSALELVKRNQSQPYPYKQHQPIIFEQYFISCLTHGRKVDFLLTENHVSKYDVKYTHLIVDSKKDSGLMNQVKRRLELLSN